MSEKKMWEGGDLYVSEEWGTSGLRLDNPLIDSYKPEFGRMARFSLPSNNGDYDWGSYDVDGVENAEALITDLRLAIERAKTLDMRPCHHPEFDYCKVCYINNPDRCPVHGVVHEENGVPLTKEQMKSHIEQYNH